MKNNLLKFFTCMVIMFIGISYTYASWHENDELAENQFTITVPDDSDIVLNEVLISLTGVDGAPMPGGEWVELKNTGGWDIDVNGWYLYDSEDNVGIEITSARTDTGDTIITAGGYLVVYRDASADFVLNNAGDTIRLYNGDFTQTLIEDYTYIGSVEDLTDAKVPDGVGSWIFSQTPTPGGSND